MKPPEVPPPRAGKPRQKANSDGSSPSEAATLLAGLEQQREELGPIAEELIDLLHHLGVGKRPLQDQLVNPSSE
jgi:hypothetical protein